MDLENSFYAKLNNFFILIIYYFFLFYYLSSIPYILVYNNIIFVHFIYSSLIMFFIYI